MPLDKKLKRVMIIGSGPIVIGQAAEFDMPAPKPAGPCALSASR